ncbi:hypothetical protein F2Q68_00024344 [Brassica cretica]|uniref:Uncharacterized protein n=1 Tax=Brassica cretica TaxID=69181 RepID=A0A8S9IAH5_BRACR|nr:hypothetical protein F2Q68_00024344 [Brassica cretica]
MEEEDVEPEEREVAESVDLVAIGQIERSREKQREREKGSSTLAQIRNLVFRSKVSGGESRRVRIAGACDVGWVFSAVVLSDFVRDWSGGVALGFLSPHLIKLWGLGGSGRRLSTLSGSRFRRCFGPVPLLYMSLGFNGCTWSRVGELEAAIFSTLLGTTASSVTISSSCCRIVFSWVLEYHMEFLETLGCIWSSKEVIRVIFGRAQPEATSLERLSQVTPARATYRSDAMNSLALYASERPPRATRRSRSSS